MPTRKQIVISLCCVLLIATGVWAQRAGTPARPPSASDAEFLQAADEVLAEMSKLLSLPALEPLKRSVRSRDEVRDYLVQQMRDDKDDAKRYADQKTLEAFGLIPKDYPLDQKLLALLTEQIAGLYDPKSREFFIADWTDPADQRMIMAHELTHALQDQHFHIQKWEDAVKDNDDAGLARESVLEGSATVAMLDYLLRDSGKSSRDIGDLDPTLLLGDASDSPELSQAPMVIQDEMLFPYIPGSAFIQHVLKTWNGWADIHKLFDNPPSSTAQILHPDLYLRGVAPTAVKLPLARIVPGDWKKLDENVLGEFGVNEVLKQFVGKEIAGAISPDWAGDRYAVFEKKPSGEVLLILRIQLTDEDKTSPFFNGYADALERKDKGHTNEVRRQNFMSFSTTDGDVLLRCVSNECVSAEGGTRAMFDALTTAIGWPATETPAGAKPRAAALVSPQPGKLPQ